MIQHMSNTTGVVIAPQHISQLASGPSRVSEQHTGYVVPTHWHNIPGRDARALYAMDLIFCDLVFMFRFANPSALFASPDMLKIYLFQIRSELMVFPKVFG